MARKNKSKRDRHEHSAEAVPTRGQPATAGSPVGVAAESGVRAPRSLLFAYMLSGAAGLLFQILWTRDAGLELGRSTLAAGCVLAVFLGCLGVGARAGSWLLARFQRPLRLYVALELAVVGASFLVRPLLAVSAATFRADGEIGSAGYVLTALAGVGLPVCLMGATFPAIVGGFVRHRDRIGGDIGMLYACNTLGAILGAAISGFVLMEALGSNGAWAVAIVLELVAVAVAAAAGWSYRPVPPEDSGAAPVPLPGASGVDDADDERPSRARWLLLVAMAFLSGLVVLAAEVLWFRVLVHGIGSTVHALATVLVAFLGGLAIGAFIASVLADRLRHAEVGVGVASFLGALALLVTSASVPQIPEWTIEMTRSMDSAVGRLGATVLVSLLVTLPFAVTAGIVFPLILRAGGRRVIEAPRTVGRLYLASSTGSVAGALLCGVFLVGVVPMQTLLQATAVASALLACLSILARTWTVRPPPESGRRRALTVVAVLPVVIAAGVAWLQSPWPIETLLEGAQRSFAARRGQATQFDDAELLFHREGKSSTVVVARRQGSIVLYSHGLDETARSVDPISPATRELSLLAYAPLLVGRQPERVMLVGLGGGHTAMSLLAMPCVEELLVAELEPAIVDALEVFWAGSGVELPTADPRLQLVTDDARALLLAQPPHSLGAFVSQPSHLWVAGVGDLLTREFFSAVASRLQPGGVAVQWVNTFGSNPQILASLISTFEGSFAHTAFIQPRSREILMLGSDEPLWFDHVALYAYLDEHPALAQRMHRQDYDVPFFLESFAVHPGFSSELWSGNVVINTDDNSAISYMQAHAVLEPPAAGELPLGERIASTLRPAGRVMEEVLAPAPGGDRGVALELAARRRLVRELLAMRDLPRSRAMLDSIQEGMAPLELRGVAALDGASRGRLEESISRLEEIWSSSPRSWEFAALAAEFTHVAGIDSLQERWGERLPLGQGVRSLVLGRLAFEQGRYEEAIDLARGSLDDPTRHGDLGESCYLLGRAELMRRDRVVAQRWFDLADRFGKRGYETAVLDLFFEPGSSPRIPQLLSRMTEAVLGEVGLVVGRAGGLRDIRWRRESVAAGERALERVASLLSLFDGNSAEAMRASRQAVARRIGEARALFHRMLQ